MPMSTFQQRQMINHPSHTLLSFDPKSAAVCGNPHITNCSHLNRVHFHALLQFNTFKRETIFSSRVRITSEMCISILSLPCQRKPGLGKSLMHARRRICHFGINDSVLFAKYIQH